LFILWHANQKLLTLFSLLQIVTAFHIGEFALLLIIGHVAKTVILPCILHDQPSW
jgi:hypothetical protein